MIDIEELSKEISKSLSNYNDDVNATVKKATKKVVQDTVKELKETSPKDTGDYAESWTGETKEHYLGADGVVYNKKHYQLTHLLENPHLDRAGNQTTPQPHIKKAEQKAVKNFKKLVEQGVSK